MKLIRNILGIILLIQLSIFLYIQLIQKNITPHQTTQKTSKHLVTNTVKPLPISTEYTEWDDEKVATLNKKIEAFNQQLKSRQSKSRQPEIKKTAMRQPTQPLPKKSVASPQKIIKVAQTNKITPLPHKKPIHKKITQKSKSNPILSLRKKIAQYAKTKLGKKYVWGAVGPSSFDCSGFTRAVYKSVTGIKIPRVSRDQAKIGKYVKYKSLKCGDMVFFDTEKKFSGRVNHVGIYLSNGNFIHASSARKKVIITNFEKKPFYKKRFLWGRRVINKS
jgi:cell wall-associated NlpC family hydrolase